MKIAQIWKNEYPWDVRVEKTCKALIDDGHEVHLICSNPYKDKRREVIDGIQIHRLPPIRNTILNKICSVPAFFNPFWLYTIFQVVKSEKIEAIIVRDLPLATSALFTGKYYKIPVLFDMAENYPSMWKEYVDKKGIKFYNHVLKNPHVATVLENYVVKKVDHIIVVIEESKKRLLEKGIPENKISIVSNTPDLKILDKKKPNDNEFLADKFKLLYVGYITIGRGLETVIKAMPIVKNGIENVCLIIAGAGEHLNELKNMASNLGVEEHIVFCGWIESALVPSYIHNSDICMVPHDVSEFVNSTIPNKLFDYMACKKPVIVSNATPLERIVKETKCGAVFRSKDAEDFAQKVLELKDPSVRSQMGINGYMAIKSKYNWQNDSQTLKKLFRTISLTLKKVV